MTAEVDQAEPVGQAEPLQRLGTIWGWCLLPVLSPAAAFAATDVPPAPGIPASTPVRTHLGLLEPVRSHAKAAPSHRCPDRCRLSQPQVQAGQTPGAG